METPNPLPPVQLSFYLSPGVNAAEFRSGLDKLAAEKNIADLLLDEPGIRNIESLSQSILPYSLSPKSFIALELGDSLTYTIKLSHTLNQQPTIIQGWLISQPIAVPEYLRQLGVDEIMPDQNYLLD